MVTVTYGANSSDLEGFAGQSVGAVRAAFSNVGVTADQAATINGRPALDSAILQEGDELAFIPTLAQKG